MDLPPTQLASTCHAVGVDGCRSGWIAVVADQAGELHAQRHDTIAELWQACRHARRILIDIRIGLLEDSPGRRACDVAARELLGPARNRVLWPPCRAALKAHNHTRASRINHQYTGRGLSIQAWSIMAKIHEVDPFLRRKTGARPIIRECHPELCFAALAGRPLTHTKRGPPASTSDWPSSPGIWPYRRCGTSCPGSKRGSGPGNVSIAGGSVMSAI